MALTTLAEDGGGSYVVSFLGALQASVAVLLTILVGVVASQFGLLSETSSKDVSKTCVKLFMPALLITNIGSQINLETVGSLSLTEAQTKKDKSLSRPGPSIYTSAYLGDCI